MTKRIKRQPSPYAGSEPGKNTKCIPEDPARPFIDTLTECADSENLKSAGGKRPKVHRLRPQRTKSVQLRSESIASIVLSPLQKAFSWLRNVHPQGKEKRLRVSETVSLGEKRFIAILQVEDRKFLIGGSSSNVAILTQLDVEPEETPAPQQSLSRVGGCKG